MVRVRRTDCAWEDGCVVKDSVQVVLQRSHICKGVEGVDHAVIAIYLQHVE